MHFSKATLIICCFLFTSCDKMALVGFFVLRLPVCVCVFDISLEGFYTVLFICILQGAWQKGAAID